MRATCETTTGPAPQRGGDVWDYVSPSRLTLYLRCPLAFKLRYLDRIACPTTPGLLVGKAVHRGLEYVYRQQQQGLAVTAEMAATWMLRDWQDLLEGERLSSQAHAQQATLRTQAVALVCAYLAQCPTDDAPPLFVERALRAPLVDPAGGEHLGIDLVGIVDLVLDAAEGPRICDFKTQAQANQAVAVAHEVQLSAYAYLVRQATGRTESGLEIRSLVKTKAPRLLRHGYPPCSGQHLRRLFAAVRAYLEDLQRGRFVYRPGWTCSFCDYMTGPCAQWPGH